MSSKGPKKPFEKETSWMLSQHGRFLFTSPKRRCTGINEYFTTKYREICAGIDELIYADEVLGESRTTKELVVEE